MSSNLFAMSIFKFPRNRHPKRGASQILLGEQRLVARSRPGIHSLGSRYSILVIPTRRAVGPERRDLRFRGPFVEMIFDKV